MKLCRFASHIISFIILLFSCLQVAIGSETEPLVLTNESALLNIDQYDSASFPNRSHSSSDEVPQHGFNASRGEFNKGYFAGEVWIRFAVENKTPVENWTLHIQPAVLTNITLFVFEGEKIAYKRVAGDGLSFSQGRDVPSTELLLHVPLKTGRKSVIYMRIISDTSMQFRASLAQSATHLMRVNLIVAFEFAVIAVLIVMFFYNLIIYLAYRDFIYLLYCAYLFSQTFFLLSFDRTGFQFLWPESLYWNQHSIAVFAAVNNFTIYCFGSYFLGFWSGDKSTKTVSFLIILLSLLLVPLGFFGPYSIAARTNIYLFFAIATMLFAVSIPSCFKKNPHAIVFMLAWGTYISAVIMMFLSKMGILPSGFFIDNAQKIGVVIETTMLSLAIAIRMSEQRKDLAKAKHEAQLEREKVHIARRLGKLEELGWIAVRLGDRLNTPLNVMLMISEEIQDSAKELAERNGNFSEEVLSQDLEQLASAIDTHVMRMHSELESLKKFRDFAPKDALCLEVEDTIDEKASS